MAQKTTEELVVSAQQGKSGAFEELIRAKQKSITYIAYTTLRHEGDREDAIQEAILTIYENLSSLRTPKAFHSWMCQIVFRTCLQIQSKTKELSGKEVEEGDAQEHRYDLLPDAHLHKHEEQRYLLEQIEKLPENYQQCLYLFYFEELSYSEIANILQVNEKSVANQLVRAKRRLKDLIEKDPNIPAFSAGLLAPASFTDAYSFEVERVFEQDTALVERALDLAMASGSIGVVAAGVGGASVSLLTKVVISLAIAGAVFGGFVLVAHPFEGMTGLPAVDAEYTAPQIPEQKREEAASPSKEAESDIVAAEEKQQEESPSKEIPETQNPRETETLYLDEPIISVEGTDVSIENNAYFEVIDLEEGEVLPPTEEFTERADPVTTTNKTKTTLEQEGTRGGTSTQDAALSATGDEFGVYTFVCVTALVFSGILIAGIVLRRRAKSSSSREED